VNVVTDADLRDARDHPDEHADLIVRVAGFCEYFVTLEEALQNEIISRTEQTET
jgi:formate C-acetyltransferase